MKATAEKFIEEIELATGLTYLEEKPEGNLCYQNNLDELQDAYKHSFTQHEFSLYLQSFSNEKPKIPQSRAEFWQRIRCHLNHKD